MARLSLLLVVLVICVISAQGKPRQDNRKQRNSNASVRSRQKGNYNKLHRQEEFVDDAEKDQEQEAVEEQSRYLAKRVIQSLRKKYRGRFTKRDLSVISSTVKRVLSKKSSCRGPTKKKYNKKKWKRQNTENDYDVESGDYEEEETAPSAEAVDAETRNSTSDGSMNINTNVNRIRPNRRSFTSNSNSNLVKSGRHGKKKLKRQNEIDGSTGESLEVPADVNVTASLEFDPTDPLVPRKSPRVKLLRKTRRGYNMNSNRNSYGSSKHKKKRYRPRQDDYIIEDNEDYSDSSSNDIGSDSESSSSEYGNVNSSDNWMNRDDDYDDEYDDEDEEYDDSDEYEDSDERLKRRRRRNRRDGEEISTTTAATPPERRGSSSSKLKSRKNKG